MIEIKKIFCFQLQSFAIFWGWLGAIFSGLIFTIGIILLLNMNALIGKFDNNIFIKQVLQVYIGLLTLFKLISILTSAGLILSVLKESHKYMFYWIFHEILCIVFDISQIAIFSFAFIKEKQDIRTYHWNCLLLMFLSVNTAFLMIRSYILIGICNLYKIYKTRRNFEVLVNYS